jgi:hydrogenase large subunit
VVGFDAGGWVDPVGLGLTGSPQWRQLSHCTVSARSRAITSGKTAVNVKTKRSPRPMAHMSLSTLSRGSRAICASRRRSTAAFVKEAWSSSTMFRGIELILRGRDPRDAWVFAQRICGVCTTVHAIASIRAVEKAIGAVPPPNAKLLRNLIAAAQVVQDHVTFISISCTHSTGSTSLARWTPIRPRPPRVAQSISELAFIQRHLFFRRAGTRIKAFVERGQLGIFANAYWGHPAYRLPPEANLLGLAHYLEALDWQRRFIKIHAILGGKNPHLQSFLVGGMATPVDPDSQNALNMETIAALDKLVAEGVAFVTQVFLPDVLAIASYYKDWTTIGAGVGNYMSYGDYPMDDGETPELFLPRGILHGRDLTKIAAVDQSRISEYDRSFLVRLFR